MMTPRSKAREKSCSTSPPARVSGMRTRMTVSDTTTVRLRTWFTALLMTVSSGSRWRVLRFSRIRSKTTTVTVVVFDRIRENLKTRHRDPLETVINNAVNQVLSRTVVVSLTVILVLIPLTLAGGEVLHDFSLALLLGVIIGTYSSVFVASPLLILWKGTPGKLLRRR